MNTLLWFLVIVVVSWLVILYVLPFLGKLFLLRLSKKFQDHLQNSKQSAKKTPEGSVHIDNIPPSSDKKKDLGDYVNYEEIIEK